MRAALIPAVMTATMMFGAASSHGAQALRYDFSEVDAIAQGTLNGTVSEIPIPGFDIRILKDGKAVYHKAFGAWTIDRVAQADSSTKTLSGAMMMSLTERSAVLDRFGRPFSLDTRLSDYMLAFGGEKQDITIRQCFSHSAGFEGGFLLEGSNTLTLQQIALQIAARPLEYAPGEGFLYNGLGMHAAGAVGEIAGGGSWNAMFEERIADPLEFAVTRYVLTTPTNPRIAGGCQSNASEFGRFMEMLRRGGVHEKSDGSLVRVLTQESVDQMFTRQSPVGVPVYGTPLPGVADYGVGVWLDQRDELGTLKSPLAAGARGFGAWIDFDDGIVGVFATDLSDPGSANAGPVYTALRAAAERAIRNATPCAADFNASGEASTQDIFDYLAAWFAGVPGADINSTGDLTVQDIFDFLELWFLGC